MGKVKKKKKRQSKPLSAETKSEKQASASATNVSNPILSEAQPDFPSLQSSVPPTGDVAPLETLEKKMSDMKVSVSATQKDKQQKRETQSGTKPKTFTYSGGECIGQKVDKFHIYQVQSRLQKVGTLGTKIPLGVNHFPMEISVPGGVIYHYDSEFQFPEKKEKKVKNLKLLVETITQF